MTSASQRLAGKVALVTGSTLGIGAATARLFAREGARVVLNSHVDDASARRIADELGPERALFVQADVADAAAVQAMVERAEARFGAVDVLVNNAGRNFFNDPLALTMDQWRHCMSVDLEGAWHCARAAAAASSTSRRCTATRSSRTASLTRWPSTR